MLRVFDLDVYALLDLGATLSFIISYIAIQFSFSPETLSKPFSLSTSVGHRVKLKNVYKNFHVTVSQKLPQRSCRVRNVDFDVILGMNWLH